MSDKEMEKKWQAEDDARTLARANEILSDPKRLEAAKATSKDQLDKLNKTVQAMTAVANMANTKRESDYIKWSF